MVIELPLVGVHNQLLLNDRQLPYHAKLFLLTTNHVRRDPFAQFFLVLDADDLLAVVAAEYGVAINKGVVVRKLCRRYSVEKLPEVVHLVEDGRAGQNEMAKLVELHARFGALALAILEEVAFVVDRDIEAHAVQLIDVGDDLFVVDDQAVLVEVGELLLAVSRITLQNLGG